MTSLSVLIMAGNEESMLPGCIATLGLADEVVVLVDDRSVDRTAEVARSAGVRVYVEPWHGFAAQRDRLAELAAGEWLLYVDADERITPRLAREIRSVIDADPSVGAYRIDTLNVFLGRPLRRGGWWPDSHLRLIRRSALAHWVGALHEVPQVAGDVRPLRQPIVHLGHRSLASMLAKTASWGPIEAERRRASSRPVSARSLLAAALKDLRWRLVRCQGWRDGTEGWIEMLYQSFSSFLSVAFLWESQRSEALQETYRRLDEHLQNGGSVEEFHEQP